MTTRMEQGPRLREEIGAYLVTVTTVLLYIFVTIGVWGNWTAT